MEILLPVSYFPPVSYFAAIQGKEKIILEKEETYPKQTIRNHCLILGPNRTQKLTVPVVRPNGNHTQTKDIRTEDSLVWKRQHFRSIETAYNNSPFFIYYKDEIFHLLMKKHELLIDLNTEILRLMLKFLRISAEISFNEEFEKKETKEIFGINKAFPVYTQVFSDRFPFTSDLSILDLLFNLGPESAGYLMNCK